MDLFKLSSKNCVNCYKCVRKCPVNAIRFKNGRAEIDEEKCIACGQCITICAKHARNVENDVKQVEAALKNNLNVIACIDSSYLSIYDEPKKFIGSLKALGFSSIQEVAIGSEIVTEKYSQYIEQNNSQKYLISSCCPTVYLYISKYYPNLTKYLVPIVTPLRALGKVIKNENPTSYTVYIGPCLSKKYETATKIKDPAIDALITFDEIKKMLIQNKIDFDNIKPEIPDRTAQIFGENYSISGDMWPNLKLSLENNGYDIISVQGLENVKCLFEGIKDGSIEKSYIKISSCNESCINGPFIPKTAPHIYSRKQKIKSFAKHGWEIKRDYINWKDIDFSYEYKPIRMQRLKAPENKIVEILNKMGKFKPSDELDCGACGYETCRDKAQAVFEGMAEIEMCMPYMRSKAETRSDIIFKNSRNTIILIDDKYNVLQINPAGEKMFNITASELIGNPITKIIDNSSFFEYLNKKTDITNQTVKYPKYGSIVLQNIVFIKNDSSVLITMQDITIEEKRKEDLDKLKASTVNTAQNVIEKQMRVAQEIASLLGETTAETKVALNKLKDIVLKEGE